jgi:hypothetical protein
MVLNLGDLGHIDEPWRYTSFGGNSEVKQIAKPPSLRKIISSKLEYPD